MDAAIMLFERRAGWLTGVFRRSPRGTGNASVTAAPPVPKPYDMAAAFTQ